MNIYDVLIKKYNIQLDENELIKIVPLNKKSFKAYPIGENENYISITWDQLVLLDSRYAEFSDDLSKVVLKEKYETI